MVQRGADGGDQAHRSSRGDQAHRSGRGDQSDRGPRSDRWWDSALTDADDPVVAATALAVLGAGLGSLFGVPILSAVNFWVVFAVGYAVVVPLASLLRGRRGSERGDSRRERTGQREERVNVETPRDDDVDAALSRLRDRYARGDLSEAQFERKLEVLLETDTPENARERVRRGRETEEGDETRDRETARDAGCR
ncbi:SHOCT domain-containing protein [Halobellus sp. GM3]|uniref:SHOCT domain-containing protein n=1 Tax=Halobellus sp. GM3 TaxID=3458410 RepID=UPI00403DF425